MKFYIHVLINSKMIIQNAIFKKNVAKLEFSRKIKFDNRRRDSFDFSMIWMTKNIQTFWKISKHYVSIYILFCNLDNINHVYD
jgi:hypothetical protein